MAINKIKTFFIIINNRRQKRKQYYKIEIMTYLKSGISNKEIKMPARNRKDKQGAKDLPLGSYPGNGCFFPKQVEKLSIFKSHKFLNFHFHEFDK